MKLALLPAIPLLFACGADNEVPPPGQMMMPPDVQPDPTPSNDCASQPADQTIQATGDVSGFWAGTVNLSGMTTIASGKKLEICPGTTINPTSDAQLIVQGELVISGTRDAMVTFSQASWRGLAIDGKLSGGFFTMGMAGQCINGRAGSQIEIVGATLAGCGQSISVANGGRFDRVNAIGGPILTTGGVLTMVDSTVDLRHPGSGPDAVVFSGGGANLDHIHITGTHCPIHMGRAPEGITVTNSQIDGAAVPVMIANASGIFTGNNVVGGSPQLDDIGGGINLDAGGNYWGGGSARASGSGFMNLDDFSTSPLEGVGPR